MAQLYQVHKGNSQKPVIVFIHGLNGNAYDTWVGPGTSSDDCWLHWLGQDTDCDTLTLDYDAALSRWTNQSMPLPDQADQIANLLSVDQRIDGRELVLIGHSMGGLVIKRLIIQGLSKGDTLVEQMVRRIRGAVLVATPHQGSHLANLAGVVSFMLRTNAQVSNLEQHDPYLRELNASFREQRRRLGLKILAFAESRDVERSENRWLGLLSRQIGLRVVDASSSDPGLEGVTTVPLAEDHLSICKPRNREAHIHQAARKFIRELIFITQENDISSSNNTSMQENKQRRYKQALELFIKENDSLGIAHTLKSIGDIENQRGNTEKARKLYEQALEIFIKEKNSLGQAHTLKSLGDLNI